MTETQPIERSIDIVQLITDAAAACEEISHMPPTHYTLHLLKLHAQTIALAEVIVRQTVFLNQWAQPGGKPALRKTEVIRDPDGLLIATDEQGYQWAFADTMEPQLASVLALKWLKVMATAAEHERKIAEAEEDV
jgi:hypothetical protein